MSRAFGQSATSNDNARIAGPQTATEPGGVVDWLRAVVERRDLTLAVPDGAFFPELTALLESLSGSFAELRQIVAQTHDAVLGDARLDTTRGASAAEAAAAMRNATHVLGEAGRGFNEISDRVEALGVLAQNTSESVNEAATNLEFIDGAMSELTLRLAQGSPLGTMRRSTDGVAGFVGTLARLSRHAQLLAVNASIEAAHLADAGARFAIVADEVRNLSTSTLKSKTDVAQIVGELRAATNDISQAVNESGGRMAAANAAIAGAGQALVELAEAIEHFDGTVAALAAVNATQRHTLEATTAALSRLASRTEEAARAAGGAEPSNARTRLENAQTLLAAWKLLPTAAAGSAPQSERGGWIADLAAGAEPAPAGPFDGVEFRPIAAAIRSMLRHINTDQCEISAAVSAAAGATARVGDVQRVAHGAGGVEPEAAEVRESVSRLVAAAGESVAFADTMETRIEAAISDRSMVALEQLDEALKFIARINERVDGIDGSLLSMDSAAKRADEIMALIEMLSSETDLLSLNAAIEAAHAGTQGLGFGVIAEEIQSLARSTNESTSVVSQLAASISGSSNSLQESIASAQKGMKNVVSYGQVARSAIEAFRGLFARATDNAGQLANAASRQRETIERVADAAQRCIALLEGDPATSADASRVELASLASRAHAIANRTRSSAAAPR